MMGQPTMPPTGILLHAGFSAAMKLAANTIGKLLHAAHLDFAANASMKAMVLRIRVDEGVPVEQWFFAIHEIGCAPGQHTLHVDYKDARSPGWHDAATPVLVQPGQITHVRYEPHVSGGGFKLLGSWPLEVGAYGPNVTVAAFDGSHPPARVVRAVDDLTLVQTSDGKQRWYPTSRLTPA